MTGFTLSIGGRKPFTGGLTVEPKANVYRVRKWGDPVMVAAGFSTALIRSTNFQAVGLYNKVTNQMGGVSNYLRIPKGDINRLAAMQIEDDYADKQPGFNRALKMESWRVQKMNWLAKDRGTIYFWFHHLKGNAWQWFNVDELEWGTIVLGNTWVGVEDVETLMVAAKDGVKRPRKMARLAGFRRSDWDLLFDADGRRRPQFGQNFKTLVDQGLIHRCYCAYFGDDLGDTPKGIVYSPFWSPRDWQLIGPGYRRPDAFYIPTDWLAGFPS